MRFSLTIVILKCWWPIWTFDMKFFLIGLGLHLLVLAHGAKKDEKKEETSVVLEGELLTPEERQKRASAQDERQLVRQVPEVSPEYLSLLQQQFSAQGDQHAAAQQVAAQQAAAQQAAAQQVAAQQAAAQQQHLIQPLVIPKDGLKQPTRYILSQDGRLLEESVYLSQVQAQPQYVQIPPQYDFQSQTHAQAQAQVQAQAQAQAQVQAQQAQLGRPGVSPEFAEYSRQQQRLQQQYAEAPLRAQIANSAARTRQRPVQPPPTSGPNSQAPQVFVQPQQTGPDTRLRTSLTSDGANFVYAPAPVDAQAILQQQLTQLAVASDGRQYFPSAQPAPQPIVYHQPPQPDFTQERVLYEQQQPTFPARRPVTPPPQPQILPQNLPQQYLIETTRPQPPQPQQPTHYVPQEAAPQITSPPSPQRPATINPFHGGLVPQVQYVQPGPIVPQPVPQAAKPQYASTLLQPVAGRGLFDPVKPSKSSIFVSRASTPKPVAIDLGSETTRQKIPVYRLSVPTEQRPLTRQDIDSLVTAGYVAHAPIPEPLTTNYIKSKRQQTVPETGKNHVVYENHQDGVQYQYSPGSPSPKSKKSVTQSDDAEPRAPFNDLLVAYNLAIGNQS